MKSGNPFLKLSLYESQAWTQRVPTWTFKVQHVELTFPRGNLIYAAQGLLCYCRMWRTKISSYRTRGGRKGNLIDMVWYGVCCAGFTGCHCSLFGCGESEHSEQGWVMMIDIDQRFSNGCRKGRNFVPYFLETPLTVSTLHRGSKTTNSLQIYSDVVQVA